MIAIIDSGSTKADWSFIENGKIKKLDTEGMNPNIISPTSLYDILKEKIVPNVHVLDVKKVYFFGTGCSGTEQKKIVLAAFQKIFTNAQIEIEHDIKGAVLATCGNQPGISCIIGTGSNSVYFDGEKIHPNNYGLGYILADEGAGTYLGKKIITNYLYDILPKSLAEKFKSKYNLSKDEVIKQVYHNQAPNAWLASFSVFYSENKEDEWIKNTIRNGFTEFLELFVMNFPGYKNIPVHFIGSIATVHQDLLREVANENEVVIGKIIQKPIDELTEYFMKQA